MGRDIEMTRRQVQREIDVCLAAKIECEKTGKTTLAQLHKERLKSLAERLERVTELG